MNKTIFIPSYSPIVNISRTLLSIMILFFLVIFVLAFNKIRYFSEWIPYFIVMSLGVGSLITAFAKAILSSFANFPNNIFFDDYIHIHRLLFPDLTISYQEIIDINKYTIKHSKGSISLSHMKNANELKDIISSLKKEKLISPNQSYDELSLEENKKKTFGIASIISILAPTIICIVLYIFKMFSEEFTVNLVVFLTGGITLLIVMVINSSKKS